MGKSSKDKRDAYYRLAKEQSWRARSAFKLLHLDETFNLFGPDVSRVVDLCAAPGSWSQVLSRVLIKGESLGRRAWEAKMKRERKAVFDGLEGCLEEKVAGLGLEEEEDDDEGELRPRRDVKVVAVDLQPIAPLEGITTLIADITHPSTIPRILHALDPDTHDPASTTSSHPVDLVISDGAPDVTGLHDLDIYIQAQLLFSALNLALRVLKPNGKFVAKIFRGKDVDLIYAQLRCFFEKVTCAKPRSSRASSLEAFVVCEGFQVPQGFQVEEMLPLGIGGTFKVAEPKAKATAHTIVPDSSPDGQKRYTNEDGMTIVELDASDDEGEDHDWIAPFVACGDLSAWDADATYHLPKDYVSLDPVRPPMNPPYKKALEERRRKGGLYGKTKG
ncbi:MAG: hypothetical protein Q9163_004974 [Psora crenata]